jgi:flavodoxin
MKTLVVYYSRTGNTKSVAEKVAQTLEAEMEEIVDEKNRRGWIGFLKAGYDATVGNRTRIAETKKDPREFDWIIVGTPVWNSRPSPAIRTYLSKNDLTGKRVTVFCTSLGMGEAKAIERTKALVSTGDFTESLIMPRPNENKADDEKKISEWINKIMLI